MNALEQLFAPSANNHIVVSISKRVCKVSSDMILNKDLVAPHVLKELNKIQFGTKQHVSRAGSVYIAHSIFNSKSNYKPFQRG